MGATILEHCAITPAPDSHAEQSFPLLHFDITWLPFHLMENILFYHFPCSKSHFLETIAPNLKKSLGITLKHFLPLAGKIIFPLTSSDRPVARYLSGDSMSLTFAESKADFIHLTGSHPRNAHEFHDFIPHLPPPMHSSESIEIPVAAIQVTLIPNQGICIGFTSHHAIGDGMTLVGFVQAWASITKFNGDTHLLASTEKYLPFYDRSSVEHLNSTRTEMKNFSPIVFSTKNAVPSDKVRGTFILSEADIHILKNSFLDKTPVGMSTVTSFMIVSAYVWICFIKSTVELVDDNEPEYLVFAADCRARIDPPLPVTYFGNCLLPVITKSTHGRLLGKEGILDAVHVIREAIQKTLNGIVNGGVEDSEEPLSEVMKLIGKRVLGVSGSPRFDLYGADYGWGCAKKFEMVHIDCDGSVSICKSSKEFKGGVEIGLSLPKATMDAFTAVFYEALGEATGDFQKRYVK